MGLTLKQLLLVFVFMLGFLPLLTFLNGFTNPVKTSIKYDIL